MEVSAIMSSLPVTAGADATLDEATELMDAHEIRHLVVLDGHDVVGVVADRDLLEATGWRQSRSGKAPRGPSNEHRRRVLSEVMHPPTRVLSPEDDVTDAAIAIAERRVGCLPVLKDGVPIGVVTETDILEAYRRECAAGRIADADDGPISGLMTRGLATVGPQDTLAEAVEILERYAVRHLPVVRGDALVGMISERDIARARGRNAADDVQIDQHMSEHVVTAEAGAPLSTAAALMIEHRISSLSVVESGALVGIVTMTDLLDHCMSLFRDAREYDVTSPAKEPQ